MTNNALKKGIEIFRDSLKIGWNNNNFLLKGGDSLNVLKKTGLVLVEGEVNAPEYISFNNNKNSKYYIKKAGGFTSFADKNNVYITYPNGISIPNQGWFLQNYRGFSYPC